MSPTVGFDLGERDPQPDCVVGHQAEYARGAPALVPGARLRLPTITATTVTR